MTHRTLAIGCRFRDCFGTVHTITGHTTDTVFVDVSECKNSNLPGHYSLSTVRFASHIGRELFPIKPSPIKRGPSRVKGLICRCYTRIGRLENSGQFTASFMLRDRIAKIEWIAIRHGIRIDDSF